MRSVLHAEADFDGYLPMLHPAFVDAAARFDHLEPTEVLDGFMRAFDGLFNGVVNGSGRSAGEFEEFINEVLHGRSCSGFVRPVNCSRKEFL